MEPSSPDPLERVRNLDQLLVRVQADPRMEAEMARARREFFGTDRPPQPAKSEEATAAYLRFCEWFLLERESENLGSTPLVRFESELEEELRSSLRESIAGVFLVESVGDEGLEVADLQSNVRHEVRQPAIELAVGDLMVGRLYPGQKGLHNSAAMTVYRGGEELAGAFQRDLGSLRLERRLSQRELEHLILARLHRPEDSRGEATMPLERLEAALETLLESAGAPDSATEISADLRRAERPGTVTGPLMDRLAFDTSIDLERLRRLLLEIWKVQHTGPREKDVVIQPPAERDEPPSAEGLGAELVRTLDEGLRKSEDVEVLFARLAEMAGCDLEEGAAEAETTGEGESAADLGDLAALIQEYLWETDQQEGAAKHYLQQWVELQQNAPVPRTDLEYVTGEDLVRLLLHVYLGAVPRQRAATVREAFSALEDFYRWAETTQEYEVSGALDPSRHTLMAQLDRLHAASLGLSSSDRPDAVRAEPCMMRVEEVGAGGVGVRPDGESPAWVRIAPEIATNLRVGDLVLGVLRRGTSMDGSLAGMVVVLPEEAESLVG